MKRHRCLLCNKLTYTWFCELHYLEKEARYAKYDIEHLRDFPKEERQYWKNKSMARLVNYGLFILGL